MDNQHICQLRRVAARAAHFAAIVETFDDDTERKAIVMRLYEANLISAQSVELLFEVYGLEAA